jgi:sugar-specific transcriptional regulator TrmB
MSAILHISITPPSFMKFCPVDPEICRGQVHASWKERIRIIIIKIKIIIRNGAKTISPPNFVWET